MSDAVNGDQVAKYRLGVDVGGTFTDLLLAPEGGEGTQHRAKVLSTPEDPSRAILDGVAQILDRAAVDPGAISSVVHGTTVATNAVLESDGARVGLITSEGFEQILHLARSFTPGPLHGWLGWKKPDPPAALEDTREVPGRMSAHGQELVQVDPDQVVAAGKELIDSGVESLTVSLINSFANPAHEREIRDILVDHFPDVPVTISSDVFPEFREYERTLTACMNSYVRPRVAGYVSGLQAGLVDVGVLGPLNILKSDAGMMSAEIARRNPIYAILSGPAGGVAGALAAARRAGYPDVLTFDMGGTSTDVALCQQGEPPVTREAEVGQFRVKVPSVDVHSVGAGGGSIAHVPELTKAFRVGPQSAGADPGPACYGRGGVEPTVTDANVVVGHLPPALLGGDITLDVDAARTAVGKIAEAHDMEIAEAAEGILKIVNENMAAALRLVSVQRGYDPRDFAMVAFGGAGPLHANAVAELMGAFPVIVPPAPGLLCARGDLVADYRREFARTHIRLLKDVALEDLVRIFEELSADATEWLRQEGIDDQRHDLAFSVDMRYKRQGHEIGVAVKLDDLKRDGVDALATRFGQMHEQFYGFEIDAECELISARVIAFGRVPEPSLSNGARPDAGGAQSVGQSEVYARGEWIAAPIYRRDTLGIGDSIQGPAIVTEFDSTTVLLDGYTATVDPHYNLIIQPSDREESVR